MSSSGRSMVDIGRGGIRRDSGSTSASEIVRTRPDDCVSKTGKSGNWVSLKANVFQIDELKDFEFNQYRVDFEPDLELDKVRKALVGQKISSYGGKKKSKRWSSENFNFSEKFQVTSMMVLTHCSSLQNYPARNCRLTVRLARATNTSSLSRTRSRRSIDLIHVSCL